jgi:hypothetical protein
MIPDGPPVRELSSALDVLSAMITPAVLILASGSLILTTSNRLTRVIDRVREISAEIEALATAELDPQYVADKRTLLVTLLNRATHRARLLQRAMTRLYVALSTFVATSVAIGVVALTRKEWAVVALALGFIGAFLLFSSSILLIVESRIGLGSTFVEMDFLWKRGLHHVPPESVEARHRWWHIFGKL